MHSDAPYLARVSGDKVSALTHVILFPDICVRSNSLTLTRRWFHDLCTPFTLVATCLSYKDLTGDVNHSSIFASRADRNGSFVPPVVQVAIRILTTVLASKSISSMEMSSNTSRSMIPDIRVMPLARSY